MRKASFFLKCHKNNSLLLLLLSLLIVPLCPAQQNWPSQPIRIIVTFTPGGAPDTLARILSEKLQTTLGVSITVENKPGAGGNIGADYVAKSKSDGYTLLLGTVGTQTINPYLYTKIPYNAEKDFTPIAFLAATPNLLVVNNQVPVKTIEELITYAKSKPSELTFGSSGSGTSIHLSGELFKVMAVVEMTHIPYKGRASSIPDLIGGRITMIFDNMPSAIPLVREGSIRAIAVTSLKRSPAAPEIPTISESGLEGFNATSWFALLGPANLPKPILDKLNLETNRVLDTPEIKERLLKLGLETNTGSPDQLNVLIKEESKKWSEVVKKSGAKAE
jgi:tripartite-type tricarboxylate transporter receptor subunit TctC